MSTTIKVKLWIPLLVLLFVATVLQIIASNQRPAPLKDFTLADMIPKRLPNWDADDLPLANTEELRNAVAKTLNFDEYISRIYRQGSVTVTIYAAYWQHDKVPPRSVGVHTPDTCWVQNGWFCIQRDNAISLKAPVEGSLKPVEFGIYTLRETTQYVYFWHLVGGKSYSYNQEGLHSITAPLQDMFTFGLNQRREQLFVRIASSVPFEQIWQDPGIKLLLESLGHLGLKQTSEN